ncbi:hypothetical protein KPH14_003351 [Odynerus spinipes]|uniref:Uncharacterized protein n=1 Tax=Odynerus spinipes TaxID=1348599 RepID=A0AAD9RCI0_9HYME|nr:hypothetical protein KPH14_003351 [Odynerus spinipes]
MSNVSGISEEETIIKGKPTLVRRVSNMLKDGNYSGPPLLFRHASMQKLRHCCQNLNLFPYLLYSYDNSKSHPVARKVSLCLTELLRDIVQRFFFIYKFLRYTALQDIGAEKSSSLKSKKTGEKDDVARVEEQKQLTVQKFQRFERQRRQRIPIFLTLAVYLAPLILAFELIALCSLLIFDKYTPGFVFLISALMFLGCIAFRVLFHDASEKCGVNNRNENNKCERKKKKVQ